MKKSIALLSILFSIGGIGLSQPVFNNIPVISYGTSLTRYTKIDNAVDPGTGGADKVWDFSSVTFGSTAMVSEFKNPTTTTFGSSFSSSNLAEFITADSCMYFTMTSTSQTRNGARVVIQGQSATVVYSDPLKMYELPFSYGQSQTDNCAASFTISSIFPCTLSGNIKVEFDGYGTLKTSNGTYTNVARLKSTETDNYLVKFMGDDITVSMTVVTYSWHKVDSSIPIFAIVDQTTTSSVGSGSSYRTLFLTDPASLTSTGIASPRSLNVNIGPNPATDKINIQYNEITSDEYTTSIINEKGSTLYKEVKFYSSGETQTIDLATLPQGVYLVRITTSNGSAVEKVIKK